MKILNKRASYDYTLQETLEAGINLLGAEVKAVKGGHADLTGSFVKVIGSEAYLVNANILPYAYARPDGYDAKRTRKLLLHKKELLAIKGKTDGANLTIVPVSMYTTRNLVKVEISLGKPKKKFEKKEELKKWQINKELNEALRGKR
jgi:SsrA-binding protein